MLMLVAAASIVLGNLAAIAQQNIKRMLAYRVSRTWLHAARPAAGVVEATVTLRSMPTARRCSTRSLT